MTLENLLQIGRVDEVATASCIVEARELLGEIERWLAENRPELK